MTKAKDIRLDRYVLASPQECTNYTSLEEVKEAHYKTILSRNSKIVIVRRKMEGGYVGDILIYSEAKP